MGFSSFAFGLLLVWWWCLPVCFPACLLACFALLFFVLLCLLSFINLSTKRTQYEGRCIVCALIAS